MKEKKSKRTDSAYVDRATAAAMLGCSGAQVDKYYKVLGLLVNVGGVGRYARPRFLRSQVEYLAANPPRRPGRPFGTKGRPWVNRKKKTK
mgnify:CR=1